MWFSLTVTGVSGYSFLHNTTHSCSMIIIPPSHKYKPHVGGSFEPGHPAAVIRVLKRPREQTGRFKRRRHAANQSEQPFLLHVHRHDCKSSWPLKDSDGLMNRNSIGGENLTVTGSKNSKWQTNEREAAWLAGAKVKDGGGRVSGIINRLHISDWWAVATSD